MLEDSMIGDLPRDGSSAIFGGRLIFRASACARFLRSLRVGLDGTLGFGLRLTGFGAVPRNWGSDTMGVLPNFVLHPL
jgi:hypothetical protein